MKFGRSIHKNKTSECRSNLCDMVPAHEKIAVDPERLNPHGAYCTTLALEEPDKTSIRSCQTIAVHAHIYYTDLASEIVRYLNNIHFSFSLYVTTDSESKAEEIREILRSLEYASKIDIKITKNRGRDIGPMLLVLGQTLANYDVVLHIHTKRSPHIPALRGWRRYLMQSLLRSPGLITTILDYFERDKSLGVLYPQIYHPVIPYMRIGGNEQRIRWLLKRLGRDEEDVNRIDMKAFPAGFMFWFRGDAIMPLIRLKLEQSDFEVEAGQDDSTLAHAIERMIPYVAAIDGYYSQSYLPASMLHNMHPGAVPLSELFAILDTLSKPIRIVFYNNLDQDSSQYRSDTIEQGLACGKIVLFVYYSSGAWFVEWVDQDDGMVFVEPNPEILLNIISKDRTCEVVFKIPNKCPQMVEIYSRISRLDMGHIVI